MPDLHIPDIPDDVIEKVMERARLNGRSFEAEILTSIGWNEPGVTIELSDYPSRTTPSEA